MTTLDRLREINEQLKAEKKMLLKQLFDTQINLELTFMDGMALVGELHKVGLHEEADQLVAYLTAVMARNK